jgi:RNA polymerase sigma-70 factor (sigma-E family)
VEILDAQSPARPGPPGPSASSASASASSADDAAVAALFRARYQEMVRLAGLLGADDPEDVAQEAFARLLRRHGSLRDIEAAVGYVRATVCNLTRNRRRHLRVAALRAPAAPPDAASSEQVAIFREEHREVLAALSRLPARRREAIVLRYWLELPVSEIAAAMGVSTGTVKSQVSRGLAALGRALEGRA